MRKTDHTLRLSDADIDAICREVWKFDPQRERAVRLRLQRLTYAKIAEIINIELHPGEKAVNGKWVNRCCHRAFHVLGKSRVSIPRMWVSADSPAIAVWRILHEQTHQNKGMPGGGWKKIYPCQSCGKDDWHYKTHNAGGHRNLRTYFCRMCKRRYSSAERRALMQQVPREERSFEPAAAPTSKAPITKKLS